MATIIFTGIITKDSVKQSDEMTYFSVSESIGTRDNPQYNYFDCGCRFSDKQKEHIHAGKIVEVVGEYVTKVNKVGEKTYNNVTIYCLNVKFKGEAKPKNEVEE